MRAAPRRRSSPSSGCSAVSFHRAVARVPRRDRPARNSMGNRGWREWARRKATPPGLGDRDSRPVPRSKYTFFLQAVGRGAEIKEWATAKLKGVQRVPRFTSCGFEDRSAIAGLAMGDCISGSGVTGKSLGSPTDGAEVEIRLD